MPATHAHAVPAIMIPAAPVAHLGRGASLGMPATAFRTVPVKHLSVGDTFAMSPGGRSWKVVERGGSWEIGIESYGLAGTIFGMTAVYRS